MAGDLTSRAIRGIAWTAFGNGTQAILRIAVLMVLARYLTPHEFGVVGIALVVVGFVSIFSQIGIGPALVQRSVLKEAHIRSGFAASVWLGLVFTLAVALSAPGFAKVFRMPALTTVIPATALSFPIAGISVVAESLLRRELKFRTIANIEVLSYGGGYAIVGMTAAILGFGVGAIVAAHLARITIRSVALVCAKRHPIGLGVNIGALRELLYFSSGFTIARVFNYLAVEGDNMIVGRYLGAAALGIYGRAYSLTAMPANLIGGVLDTVLFPVMASVQSDRPRLRVAYRRGVSAVALATLPLSMAAWMLSPNIVVVVLGQEWMDAVVPFQIFAASILFRTSYKIGDSLARATGAVYRRAWRQAVYCGMIICGAAMGKMWGVNGVGCGVFVAVFTNFALMAHLSLRITGMSVTEYVGAHLPAVELAGVVLLVGWPTLLIAGHLQWPAAAALGTVTVVLLAAGMIIVRLRPKQLLGNDGRWLLDRVGDVLPGGMARALRLPSNAALN